MVNTRNGGGDANPPNINEIVAQAVAAAIQNLRNEHRDGAGSSNEGIHLWIECFNKLKPDPFLSATTPTEAGDWINHCEKLFQVISCPDGVKARLAAFKFDGDALNWWTSYVQAKGDGFVETCTWAAFREAFYKRLASFVGPTVSGDAARQARHYKWGLKRWILDRIVNTDYIDVSMVCDAARNIDLLHESGNSNKRSRDGDRIQHRGPGQQDRGSEFRGRSDQSYDSRGQFDRSYDQRRQDQRGNDRQRNDRRGNNNNNGQKQWKDQSKGYQQNRASGSSSQNRSAEILPPPPLCPSCGKPHSGPCYRPGFLYYS
ncbi:zinc finger, CCHC-type, Retrotransposon gag domain protein [Artemisia annua]|uniref:Zinc finger, CCHC-type, Retrotransposon gag domain protein n=1 Tax=Artemisia annua TaxID=35608 RepID=A0A2U1MDC8_ARTAN|nr:zinc finger, CCHC-type, Retrotransposon gag domain protein [Artemisia annua]